MAPAVPNRGPAGSAGPDLQTEAITPSPVRRADCPDPQAASRAKRGPHRLAPLLGHPRSTIYTVLRRHGCARLRDFDRVTGRPLRYVRQHAGELVHVDVKKLGVIPPGGGHRIWGKTAAAGRHRGRGYDCIYVAVDDATRVAFVSVFPDQSATSAIQFAQATHRFFAQQGVRVERIMTDQHRSFRVSKAFQAALAG